MLTTTQFLRSSPSWLPIVSQLYISLLWNFTTLATDETARFISLLNLFGFEKSQTNWFQYTCIVMNNYSKYFNGSVLLSSIIPTVLGAVAVRGVPSVHEATRSFLYPTDAEIEPFTSSRFHLQ